MLEISSIKNEKIKEVALLLEKSRLRREKGLFVVEGLREVSNCIQNGFSIESIFFNPDTIGPAAVEVFCPDRSIFSVTPEVYAKIAYREGTEGVVAVVREKRLRLDDITLYRENASSPEETKPGVGAPEVSRHNPLVLVVESVEKPGNLGALLRTADACGVDAVLVCDPLTDLYNPNLIRSSLGGIFTQQVVACTSEEAYEWLSEKKITIFTAQLQDSRWYYNADLTQPCALVMGSEAKGLSQFWRDVSHAKIKIPMLGQLDSLNVSVSAAVLCYEAVRQRMLG